MEGSSNSVIFDIPIRYLPGALYLYCSYVYKLCDMNRAVDFSKPSWSKRVMSYALGFVSFLSPSLLYLLTAGVEVVYFHLIIRRQMPQSVGLLWTRDRPVAGTSTWRHRHSQQTNIHAPGGIRTHNPRKRSAADLRPRPRGHWDRHMPSVQRQIAPLLHLRVLRRQKFLVILCLFFLSNVSWYRVLTHKNKALFRLVRALLLSVHLLDSLRWIYIF
jgi:hypothetical protein